MIYDLRRNVLFAESEDEMIRRAAEHFIDSARAAIERTGSFAVALSGGSTPQRIFERITSKYSEEIDWEKVLLFWSDERAVPPDHPDSNYRMAMVSGFGNVPLQADHIFRMCAENDIEASAKRYEELLKEQRPTGELDLVILGMGDDGHTASLFPGTHALASNGRLVVANYVPEKNCWRMTLTFDAINMAYQSVIYVMGKSKADTVARVFATPEPQEDLPISLVGTEKHPALWMLDPAAASKLRK